MYVTHLSKREQHTNVLLKSVDNKAYFPRLFIFPECLFFPTFDYQLNGSYFTSDFRSLSSSAIDELFKTSTL